MNDHINLIDTHVHLDAEEFNDDREAVIERARAAGVRRFVSIGAGSGEASARNAIHLAETHDFIWASVGIHPNDASVPTDSGVIRELAQHPRVVAIGETGLDFFRDHSPRDTQEKWFRAQVEIALQVHKPLIIHSREAGEECLSILAEMNASRVGGVFHCFGEDEHFATRLAKINFMVSFPGTVTFKKSDRLREIVQAIPLEQIMVETDAPFLAPEPFRGKRCESSFMVETAKTIAKLKGLSLEELGERTTANALKFFNIPYD